MKHHFDRFAQSLGYPTGPRSRAVSPVRGRRYFRYASPGVEAGVRAATQNLWISHGIQGGGRTAESLRSATLKHALGLSAWKRFGESRWSLRVNLSSGNLHPTEAYVPAGRYPTAAQPGAATPRIASVIEQRSVFDEGAWRGAVNGREESCSALTSIHWREA